MYESVTRSQRSWRRGGGWNLGLLQSWGQAVHTRLAVGVGRRGRSQQIYATHGLGCGRAQAGLRGVKLSLSLGSTTSYIQLLTEQETLVLGGGSFRAWPNSWQGLACEHDHDSQAGTLCPSCWTRGGNMSITLTHTIYKRELPCLWFMDAADSIAAPCTSIYNVGLSVHATT